MRRISRACENLRITARSVSPKRAALTVHNTSPCSLPNSVAKGAAGEVINVAGRAELLARIDWPAT
jgi:hypothetical protein